MLTHTRSDTFAPWSTWQLARTHTSTLLTRLGKKKEKKKKKKSSSCTTLWKKKKFKCKTSFYLKRVREVPVCVTMKKSARRMASSTSDTGGTSSKQQQAQRKDSLKITTRESGPIHQSITAILTEAKREEKQFTKSTHVAVYLFRDRDRDSVCVRVRVRVRVCVCVRACVCVCTSRRLTAFSWSFTTFNSSRSSTSTWGKSHTNKSRNEFSPTEADKILS